MPTRRSGDKNQFWDNAATGANGNSTAVRLPRGVENFVLYITVSGATTVSLQAVHSGDVNSDGTLPDSADTNWAPVKYVNDTISHTFSGAGSIVIIVPDFGPGWVRLNSTNAVTATAGWEATGG